MTRRLLLFTDVDGTLLDAETYRPDAARPGLAAARAAGAPVILNTSKTEPETRALAAELGLDAPFAVENGGGIYVPPGHFGDNGEEGLVALGAAHADILAALDELADSFRFRGISSMSDREVEAACGLPAGAVGAARERRFSEPLVWRDDPARLDEFAAALAGRGLVLRRGDRFVHVMGDTDKAAAVARLAPRYRARWPGAVSVGLGNGPNDLGMLAAADVAVVIRNPNGRNIEYPGARVPAGHGPAAWSRAVRALLEEDG